jgi:hypothetical protein
MTGDPARSYDELDLEAESRRPPRKRAASAPVKEPFPPVSTRQIKAARALLGWTQEDLSSAAGISSITVRRLEAVDGLLGGSANTRAMLIDAFSRVGVVFITEDELGVGVHLRPVTA